MYPLVIIYNFKRLHYSLYAWLKNKSGDLKKNTTLPVFYYLKFIPKYRGIVCLLFTKSNFADSIWLLSLPLVS